MAFYLLHYHKYREPNHSQIWFRDTLTTVYTNKETREWLEEDLGKKSKEEKIFAEKKNGDFDFFFRPVVKKSQWNFKNRMELFHSVNNLKESDLEISGIFWKFVNQPNNEEDIDRLYRAVWNLKCGNWKNLEFVNWGPKAKDYVQNVAFKGVLRIQAEEEGQKTLYVALEFMLDFFKSPAYIQLFCKQANGNFKESDEIQNLIYGGIFNLMNITESYTEATQILKLDKIENKCAMLEVLTEFKNFWKFSQIFSVNLTKPTKNCLFWFSENELKLMNNFDPEMLTEGNSFKSNFGNKIVSNENAYINFFEKSKKNLKNISMEDALMYYNANFLPLLRGIDAIRYGLFEEQNETGFTGLPATDSFYLLDSYKEIEGYSPNLIIRWECHKMPTIHQKLNNGKNLIKGKILTEKTTHKKLLNSRKKIINKILKVKGNLLLENQKKIPKVNLKVIKDYLNSEEYQTSLQIDQEVEEYYKSIKKPFEELRVQTCRQYGRYKLEEYLEKIPGFGFKFTENQLKMINGKHRCSVVIGRSGTGKSTCAILKMIAIDLLFISMVSIKQGKDALTSEDIKRK